ncbi:hypothetical protein ACPF04_05855 [Campylobacter sp. MOP51]|uniref:hypothetical protein n=1 Tax=Campylobacter canis TaxID=3378588 RepID=UPI003C48D2B1
MAQKLLKHELVERLLKLKEKQDELTVQMQCLSQEKPKPQPLITMRLVAQVLRENPDWMFCGEIAEKTLALLGKPQFVDVVNHQFVIS